MDSYKKTNTLNVNVESRSWIFVFSLYNSFNFSLCLKISVRK